MVERCCEQLNNGIFVSFCCDSKLVLQSYDGDLHALLKLEKNVPLLGYSLFELVSPYKAGRIRRELRQQLSSGSDVELIFPIGDSHWVLCRGVKQVGSDGVRICGIMMSLHRLKRIYDRHQSRMSRYEERLSETADRAARDSLTNLLNAHTTRRLCEEYISSGSKSFALMVIDLDHLKQINDNHGHLVGDKIIIQVAENIKKLFRNNDVVGRIGGDEFLVLMKDVTRRDIVETRSQQIISVFKNISCGDLPNGSLSCSVGAVFVDDNTNSYDALFCLADQAMYQAKAAGGSRYTLLDHTDC